MYFAASALTITNVAGTFLTGFGGHVLIAGQGEGRLRGVEFFRMGMTNVIGRYPIHFHHSSTGSVGVVADCAVHRSFYRVISVHDTFDLRVSRNVAYDITGHGFYLESGVEERNTIEYNLVRRPADGGRPRHARPSHCVSGCSCGCRCVQVCVGV